MMFLAILSRPLQAMASLSNSGRPDPRSIESLAELEHVQNLEARQGNLAAQAILLAMGR
jgi:hypothetical protein